MFNNAKPLPADPILGVMAACARDTNPKKVDLGVGVYKENSGSTPIFASVKRAEANLIAEQQSKAYIGPAGSAEYNRLMTTFVFGDQHTAVNENRIASVQTPGGCGALRVGAELLKRMRPSCKVWLSNPTWANHNPLLGDTGIALDTYPYYDKENNSVLFEDMITCLKTIPADDVVLIHGCCHNPSGADLSDEQWQVVADIGKQQGFLVYIDLAYQGFGNGIEEDAYGVRLLAEQLPELMVANSCSKNFGLYRERTGTLFVMTEDETQAQAVASYMHKIARGIYSMPPAHGAGIVETLLSDQELVTAWHQELVDVRQRIKSLRKLLADAIQKNSGNDSFRFIEKQCGMFSYLGLTTEQVVTLREKFSIYMTNDSRVNIAGLKPDNIEYVAEAIASVI